MMDDRGDVNNTCTSSAAGVCHEQKECHKAAKMFRKSFQDISLNTTNSHVQNASSLHLNTPDDNANNSNLFYAAYIQTHWLLKSTNLRLNKNNESEQIFCTQQWPRSLCTRDAINRFNSDYNHIDHYVTCLNPAEVWCDHPLCKEARCGKQGCLRCYRFLPRDYTLSANGSIVSRQSERSYDIVSFVKCCWCCVSFCDKHMEPYYEGKIRSEPHWYQCDVCQKSSCPDCVSQVFDSIPDPQGCQVVSGGRVCAKKLCIDCSWYVGTLKNSSEVVAKQGVLTSTDRESMASIEECCPTCRLQVEKRMKEMEDMRNSFMGFLP